ncbi:MAG: prephenate dehydratase [Dermatophilaceae bacterium]
MPMTRYGYLGPEGTFCQMALGQWGASHDGERVPFGSVGAALAAVRTGEIDAAMVPIENSVEGGVSATLDALSVGEQLHIVGEVLVPVTFVLAAPTGMPFAEIRAVGTHSHAWAQVRGWMERNLPGAAYVPTLSTAASAQSLHDAGTAPFDAAVCAPVAASAFGLHVLAEDIGDNGGAVTRFVLVSRPGSTPGPTGRDKTTVVLFQRADRPGGLLELLEQFAVRGVNMTRLESRPTGEAMGSYCFSIDFEGHLTEERVRESLIGLKRVCMDVRFLGSYARADGQASMVEAGMADGDFVQARAWLDALTSSDGG